MSGTATGSAPSGQLAGQLAEHYAEILEVCSPITLADEERPNATAKKWPARQSILFLFVTNVILWALIILGARQLF